MQNIHLMQNILMQELSVAEIAGVLEGLDPAPLLPPLGDAQWAEWGARAPLGPWKAALRARAEEHFGQEPPPLTPELYEQFQRDGQRLPFERAYFGRRNRLADAALCALLFAGEAQWQAETVRLAQAILDEESWTLPAHTPNTSGQDPLCIDLFAAETADSLATLVALLGAGMPAEMQRQIRARVRVQITDNFLTRYGSGGCPASHWTHAPMNWNAVCHQGVVGATLTLEQDRARVAQTLFQAAEGLRVFSSSFGADGGSSEGPGYWNYGFGRFAWLNEQLETYSRGALSLFGNDPHMRQIAAFARRMCVDGVQCVPFADSDPHVLPDAVLSAYLGARLGDPASTQQAQVSYARALSGTERGLLERLCLVRWCPAQVDGAARARTQDWYFADLQVMVAAGTDDDGRRAVVAAKGGSNAEHHNHNDVGSFAYYVDGTMFAIELGAPEYVKAFFGPERYGFFAARSQGHSVPLINGCEQGAGRDSAAAVLQAEHNGQWAHFVLDITPAYPAAAECVSAVRAFVFDKQTLSLQVTDTFTLRAARSLETALLTDADVFLLPGGAARLHKDGLAVRVQPGPGTRVEPPQSHTFAGHDGVPRTVSRLSLVPEVLSADVGAAGVALSYTLSPE